MNAAVFHDLRRESFDHAKATWELLARFAFGPTCACGSPKQPPPYPPFCQACISLLYDAIASDLMALIREHRRCYLPAKRIKTDLVAYDRILDVLTQLRLKRWNGKKSRLQPLEDA